MIIVFVITGLGQGGAETMLFKLLQGLDRQRFTPHVISLSDHGHWGSKITELNIPVHALGMRPGTPNPMLLLSLVRLIRSIHPHVVHTWMYHADLLGGIAARVAGVSAVAWGIRHSNLSPSLNKRSTLAVAALCARLSSWLPRRILACSETARESHIAFGYMAKKMEVIPNGFDLTHFRPDPVRRQWLRESLRLSSDTVLIGQVGRFHAQKNQIGFLRAMGILHSRMPHVRFVLAGTGVTANNKQLVAAAQSSGILHACYFLGPRNDIPHIMPALDILISASVGEAFPNVLGEAMACATPCIATNVGDCADILADTGVLVPSADTEKLAAATEELLRLPPETRQTMGHNGRMRVQAHFEISHVVARFEHFYENLVV